MVADEIENRASAWVAHELQGAMRRIVKSMLAATGQCTHAVSSKMVLKPIPSPQRLFIARVLLASLNLAALAQPGTWSTYAFCV